MLILKAVLKWLTGGVLGRVFDTIDARIASDVNKDKIKGDIIQAHLATRGDYMRAGGFWLMAAFAVPLALWFAAVVVYSVFWCSGCAYPQPWSVAALPAPLDEWAGIIIVSIFGVVGLSSFKR